MDLLNREKQRAPGSIQSSLKLVHFIGVPDLQVRDLHDGAQAVALPAGVPARVVQDAVRFALLGRVPDISGQVVNVISEGQGYTWVEAAFRSAEGLRESLRLQPTQRSPWDGDAS